MTKYEVWALLSKEFEANSSDEAKQTMKDVIKLEDLQYAVREVPIDDEPEKENKDEEKKDDEDKSDTEGESETATTEQASEETPSEDETAEAINQQ